MRVSSSQAAFHARQTGLWTTKRVVDESGLTYRTIDYWTRIGLITPAVEAAGSGSARLWDPAVVETITELQRRIEECPFHPHHGRPA